MSELKPGDQQQTLGAVRLFKSVIYNGLGAGSFGDTKEWGKIFMASPDAVGHIKTTH